MGLHYGESDFDINRAILLLTLVIVLLLLVFSIRSRISSKHHLIKEVRRNFALLDPSYSNIPIRTGTSAYTENKEVITLCIINPETGKEYDINTIMYVALHELAHVITPDGKEEHGEDFKLNFSLLLNKAARLGIYDPSKPIPSSYCHTNTGM